MFLPRTRGLSDLLLATLCLWGACYQTPVGAALRGGMGLVIGHDASVRSVLGYYNSGVYTPEVLGQELRPLPVAVTVSEPDALAYGVYSVWETCGTEQRARALGVLKAYGVDSSSMKETRSAAKPMAHALRQLTSQLGSEDAAVLAVLCGTEPARYASERAKADGGGLHLEQLVRQLPPGYDEEISAASRALMLGRAYGLAWPVSRASPISSSFGSRTHPMLGEARWHKGIDISLPDGSPIRAAGEGRVAQSGRDGVNGVWVSVDHGRGVTTSYLHVAKAHVQRGDIVRRGQLIADSGHTGLATGPHLHYQLELGRVPVDPLRFSNGSSSTR
jgi:murein DD-endopeptidase